MPPNDTDIVVATITDKPRFTGRLYLRVRTYNDAVNPDDPESDVVVDYSDPERRDWLLNKHCIWAWTNGRSVDVVNLRDDPK